MYQDIYEGIDEKRVKEIVKALNVLGENFNEGDIIVKNYIVNHLFEFIMSVVASDKARGALHDAYRLLE